jgi:hypothetical protein
MKDFKRGDVKGSRYRKCYKKISMKKVHEKYATKNKKVDFEQFKDIVSSFSKFCYNNVLKHRYGIELMANLGNIKIMCYTEQRTIYDIAKSIDLGKLVTYNNLHTDGYSAKIYYSNLDVQYRFPNREIWSFKPVRHFKKAVSKTFEENYKLFDICVPKSKREIVSKDKRYSNVNAKLGDIFNDYNEFEI